MARFAPPPSYPTTRALRTWWKFVEVGSRPISRQKAPENGRLPDTPPTQGPSWPMLQKASGSAEWEAASTAVMAMWDGTVPAAESKSSTRPSTGRKSVGSFTGQKAAGGGQVAGASLTTTSSRLHSVAKSPW